MCAFPYLFPCVILYQAAYAAASAKNNFPLNSKKIAVFVNMCYC